MSNKCEKIENFSKKVEFFFEKKSFFRSQNLVIWSGNSAEFPVLEAKKRIFSDSVLGPTGPGPLTGRTT